MGVKIVWAPSSRADLRNLITYIAQEDPGSAERMGFRILEKAEQASQFPSSGRIVPEFGISDIRELQLPPYRIIYRIRESESLVEIVRVWHASRDRPIL